MKARCIACDRRGRPRRGTSIPGGYACPVCWTHLGTAEQRDAAHERLNQWIREWLAAAPVYPVSTNDGKPHPDDPAYKRVPMSVLGPSDAAHDLGKAIEKLVRPFFCPDTLAFAPEEMRSDWEFEFLEFPAGSFILPERYADAMVRERHHFRSRSLPAEVKRDVGSIHRSPSGDVIVIWRLSGA